jgi:endonuclease/exonuclease/phosphatase family metal-dependent hydrolase
MSAYPLSEVERIVLPHPGPGKRRRVALGATVSLGDKKLRVYSVHSETRIAVRKKVEQLQAVLADLSQYPNVPAILMGDFNTWEPDAVSATNDLFKKAGFQTPFNGDSTFCRRLFLFDLKLKLDWIWLRGVESTSHGIDRSVKISDHWPLWAVLRMREKSFQSAKQ